MCLTTGANYLAQISEHPYGIARHRFSPMAPSKPPFSAALRNNNSNTHRANLMFSAIPRQTIGLLHRVSARSPHVFRHFVATCPFGGAICRFCRYLIYTRRLFSHWRGAPRRNNGILKANEYPRFDKYLWACTMRDGGGRPQTETNGERLSPSTKRGGDRPIRRESPKRTVANRPAGWQGKASKQATQGEKHRHHLKGN